MSPKKLNKLSCDEITSRLQRNQDCLDARTGIQDQCFGGTPDNAHAAQIEAARRAVDHCQRLYDQNCAQ